MNKSLIILSITLLFSSCTNEITTVKYTPNFFNILLQNKKYPRYIFLTRDTAFYERVQFEKPSYFTDLDTLILNKTKSIYFGKNSFLQRDSNHFVLNYTKGRNKGKQIIFEIANKNQIMKWNMYKKTLHFFQQ